MDKVNKLEVSVSKFSTEQVAQYWQEFPDPAVYQIIKSMESVENWILDNHKEVEKALEHLSQSLEIFKTRPALVSKYKEEIIHILAYIKTGRALYFLHELEQIYPGAFANLISYAQEHCQHAGDAMSIFLRRSIVFERLRIIKRVFSTERINSVIKVLEQS